MSLGSRAFRIILPVAIVAAGIGVMVALVSSREAPKKEARRDPGALVRVIKVERSDRRAVVAGTGTVQSARVVSLVPQVSGRVVEVSPTFVSGGFFKEGEVLFRIDDADYRLALRKAEAAKVRSEYDLAKVESQARIARSEWERVNDGKGGSPNPLVLYEPQLKDAKAALRSAEASVEQASLNLERTVVRAPFNSRVSSEEVETGQYVQTGKAYAVLTGTDTAEILVPLSLDELAWLDVPQAGGKGPQARIIVNTGENRFQWDGRVDRSVGEVDPKGRMMHVVVSVDDPYGLGKPRRGGLPLAAGTFVEVMIEGRPVKGVFVIPRRALRDGSTVWTVDGEKRLRIRKVTPARFEGDEVLIKEGLDDGDRVITTTLSGAADGMRLRPVEPGGPGAAEGGN